MAGINLLCYNFLQGEGTREGTGKCNCDNGYQGDLCDECKDGFFEESKNDTHTKCTGMRKTSWVEMIYTIFTCITQQWGKYYTQKVQVCKTTKQMWNIFKARAHKVYI